MIPLVHVFSIFFYFSQLASVNKRFKKTYIKLKTTSAHAFGVSSTESGINWSLHDTSENDDPEIIKLIYHGWDKKSSYQQRKILTSYKTYCSKLLKYTFSRNNVLLNSLFNLIFHKKLFSSVVLSRLFSTKAKIKLKFQ